MPPSAAPPGVLLAPRGSRCSPLASHARCEREHFLGLPCARRDPAPPPVLAQRLPPLHGRERQQRVHKPRRGSGIGHGSADGVWSRPARDPPLHQLGRADRSELVAAVGGVGGVRAAEAGRRQFEQRRRVAVVGSDAACARKPLTQTLEWLAQAAHPLAVWPGLQRASSACIPTGLGRRCGSSDGCRSPADGPSEGNVAPS